MRALRTLPALALLACGFVACGGADETRPTTDRVLGTPPDECLHGESYADRLVPITNFDLVNFEIVCGSADTFWCVDFYNWDKEHSPPDNPLDEAACDLEILDGQVVPDGTVVESHPKPVPHDTERCGAPTSALNFLATNLGMCKGASGRLGWGGGYEIDFSKDKGGSNKAPTDASAYDGFSFWIKRGTGKTGGALIVLAVDSFAAGAEEQVDPETGDVAHCLATDPVDQPIPDVDSEKCDPFSVGVTLTDDWTFVPVHFADLSQKGFGKYAPEGFKPSELVRLQFIVNAGDWDFWIDDLSFFNDP